jgi:hypothetical protein
MMCGLTGFLHPGGKEGQILPDNSETIQVTQSASNNRYRSCNCVALHRYIGRFFSGRGILLAMLMFLFFSGIDRFVVDKVHVIVEVDWLWQAYVFAAMVSIGLIYSTQYSLLALGLAALNLVLLPFNHSSAFLNRVGFAFWIGTCAKIKTETNNYYYAIALGALIGSISVIIDAVLVVWTPRLVGSGFFLNPSFAITLLLALFALSSSADDSVIQRHLPFLAGVILAAVILSAARASIVMALVALPIVLTPKRLVISLATGMLIVFCVYSLPHGEHLVFSQKIKSTWGESIQAIEIVLRKISPATEVDKVSPATEVDKVSPAAEVDKVSPAAEVATSASERAAGLLVLSDLAARLLFPLSKVTPNDVGHIGAILYLSVFGLLLLIVYVIAAAWVLTLRNLILISYLMVFFTSPLLHFGLGILYLHMLASPKKE